LDSIKHQDTLGRDDEQELSHFISTRNVDEFWVCRVSLGIFENHMLWFSELYYSMCICLSVFKWGKWISASISEPLAEGNSAKIWEHSPYGHHVQNNHVQSSTVFLEVETNSRFLPVATFIVGSETTESIRECLEAIHQANPSWHPLIFVVDYSLPEIQALESVFSGNHFWTAYLLQLLVDGQNELLLAQVSEWNPNPFVTSF